MKVHSFFVPKGLPMSFCRLNESLEISVYPVRLMTSFTLKLQARFTLIPTLCLLLSDKATDGGLILCVFVHLFLWNYMSMSILQLGWTME